MDGPKSVVVVTLTMMHVMNCATLRVVPIAKSKSKASPARKRSSNASAKTKKSTSKAKKISAKPTKSNARSRALKKRIKGLTWDKNFEELTLIMFQTIYEDYQEGRFVPLFH